MGLRAALEAAPLAVFTIDGAGVCRLAEGQALRLLGVAPDAIGHPLMARLAEHSPFAYHLRRATGGATVAETVTIEGHALDIWLQPLPDGGVAGAAAEATGRVHVEERLVRQAYFDPLTGLANRHLFSDRLALAMARTQRGEPGPAVLLIDVDRLGRINESLGNQAGDEVLIELGRRLAGRLRPADSVARFVADTFAVLCESVADPVDAAVIAERLRTALADPFVVRNREVFLSASIGVALPELGQDPEAVLGDAETALYRAKSSGAGRSELFDPDMRVRALALLETEQSLYRALERDEFSVHYQPVIDLSTGVVAGLEALVRWEHPEQGLTPPAQFIPLAEETGLIVPIGYWILEEVSRQIRDWRDEGLFAPTMTMAVNLSAVQLAEPDLPEVVATIFSTAELAPAQFCFEITESCLMDYAAAIGVLHRFRQMGISLAVDDFGTGFSSLGYLSRLPIDALKVDRAFVKDVDGQPTETAIAEAIVGLAHVMGLRAVAEGVETLGQLSALRALGCDEAQGFLFSAALPSDRATLLLRKAPRW